MIKTVVIGSCMSNLTVQLAPAELGLYQTHCIHHNRSDAFIRYFVDRSSEMIPRAEMDALLIYKEETERDAREILKNQYPETGGYFTIESRRETPESTFLSDLTSKPVDLILLDNYMDISSKLMIDITRPTPESSPIFLNVGFYKNQTELMERFKFYGDYLTPAESAENWIRIYRWLRKMQPKAKIAFLCYHSVSSVAEPARFERLKGFYPELVSRSAGDDLIIVPPLHVPDELTKGPVDWPHFQPPVYKALAGLAYLLVQTDLAETRQF